MVGGARLVMPLMAIGALVLAATRRSSVRRAQHDASLVESERARMSREIHDTLLQSLVGTALHLDSIADEIGSSQPAIAQRLARTRRQIERHIDDAHEAIFALRAPDRPTRTLEARLRDLCEAERDDACRTTFVTAGEPPGCEPGVQHQLLRIAGEAIVNAKRHANATQVTATLSYPQPDGSLRLTVEDDGVGFDVERVAAANGHYGLTIMRERAEQIRARFAVRSTPGHGTTIEVHVPVERRDPVR